jgi:hypothetical protein
VARRLPAPGDAAVRARAYTRTMDVDREVTFIELAGPTAEDTLRTARAAMARRGRRTELLHSSERDDLWLLMVRGPMPAGGWPRGARTWRFVTADDDTAEGPA